MQNAFWTNVKCGILNFNHPNSPPTVFIWLSYTTLHFYLQPFKTRNPLKIAALTSNKRRLGDTVPYVPWNEGHPKAARRRVCLWKQSTARPCSWFSRKLRRKPRRWSSRPGRSGRVSPGRSWLRRRRVDKRRRKHQKVMPASPQVGRRNKRDDHIDGCG